MRMLRKLALCLWIALLLGACQTSPTKPDATAAVTAEDTATKQAEPVAQEKIVRPQAAICRLMEASVTDAQEGFRSVYQLLADRTIQSTAPALTLFYKPLAFDPKNARYETCVPVASVEGFKDTPLIKGKTLPGGVMLSLVHQGGYHRLHQSYERLFANLDRYDVVGPSREIYLRTPVEDSPDGDVPSTELQLPVMRKTPPPTAKPDTPRPAPSQPMPKEQADETR